MLKQIANEEEKEEPIIVIGDGHIVNSEYNTNENGQKANAYIIPKEEKLEDNT